MRAFVTIALFALMSAACDRGQDAQADVDAGDDTSDDAAIPPPPRVELGRHTVTVTETRRIVPSDGLPATVSVASANNNLDVIRFANRVWLVWRTAPDHFAGDETRMVIVSSEDERTWTLEKTFAIGTDLREPRWLVIGGELFVYFAVLGKNPSKFEPQGIRYAKRAADGTFTDLSAVLQNDNADAGAATPMTGAIAWRIKTERGKPYMSAYYGGEHIYAFDGLPLEVNLLTTNDGATWRGVDVAKPVVSRGGGSEMDFTLTDDGTLFAVIRNEAGDETGFGSKICRAPASTPATFTCRTDPKKYDSPLVFFHDGEVYLVGRRNVTLTGNYDLGQPAEDLIETSVKYQIDYRTHPKRCSLWRYVQQEDRIAFILDLPSRGDTCFASRLDVVDAASPEEIVFYNYSSDIDGADVSWAEGQVEPTYLYRHVLRFTPR